MPNIHSTDFAGRMAEIERRLSAMERRPMSIDLPIVFDPFQNFDATGRAIPVYTDVSWTLCYHTSFPIALFPGLYVVVHVQTPAGTTAEVRLTNLIAGATPSGAYSVPAATDYRQAFHWLHGQPLGTGPFAPSIEVRRTSGTGTIQVYLPTTPLLVTQQTINVLGRFTADGRI